jgi:hypothetical protein
MAKKATATTPPADTNGRVLLDLTDMECLWFEYQVRAKEPNQPPVTITLDFERIAVDLTGFVPTIFQPSGEMVHPTLPDGTPDTKQPLQVESNLGMMYRMRMKGIPDSELPKHLPSWRHLESAIRKSFEIPPHCTVNIVFRVLHAYLEETNRRAELKKGTPDSPDSHTTSPE